MFNLGFVIKLEIVKVPWEGRTARTSHVLLGMPPPLAILDRGCSIKTNLYLQCTLKLSRNKIYSSSILSNTMGSFLDD
ncbi:hypothetical protein RIF29_26232 [Crotalaria pallida]|uniref:Uncharacterized protein n=1 Tax=Crotalaria pallida TaxID=3830 RepID=A0AAN9EMF1_CROPI